MLLEHEQPLAELEEQLRELLSRGAEGEAAGLKQQIERLSHQIFAELTPLQRLSICRHGDRPKAEELISRIVSDQEELYGDRLGGDDPALRAYLARIGSQRTLILAQDKGVGTQGRIARRFGMMNPEGYRKAQRCMKLAERFSLPLLTLIDTPGAYPGLEAEEKGQGWAIAETIALMGSLKIPTLAVVIGEGCSGGALALAVADRLALLEHAYFSVIAPEGCSSILWKDRSAIGLAAQALRMQAEDLACYGLVDDILPEPRGGAHRDISAMAETLKNYVVQQLDELVHYRVDALISQRAARYRSLGLLRL
jgi:acetyl-CoA carboxylase carboxyl transferase subunit alpha